MRTLNYTAYNNFFTQQIFSTMETTVMQLEVQDLPHQMKMLLSHSFVMNVIQPMSRSKIFKIILLNQNTIPLLMESVWFVEKFSEVTYANIFGDLI